MILWFDCGLNSSESVSMSFIERRSTAFWLLMPVPGNWAPMAGCIESCQRVHSHNSTPQLASSTTPDTVQPCACSMTRETHTMHGHEETETPARTYLTLWNLLQK